jgi:hypothetical protein
LISCGSSSTTSGIDAAPNTIDTGSTPNTIDAAPSTNAIDTSSTPNTIDAAPSTNAIDTGSTPSSVDATAIDVAPTGIDATAIDAAPTAGNIDGGPNNGCPNLAGAYSVTTQIVNMNPCKVGLNTITEPITYTFKQTAPSCSFTMAASIYPSSNYSGHFVMAGGKAKVIWDSVDPAPTILGYAVSYTGEDLTITPGTTAATSTLAGSFTWHVTTTTGCDGTTNVCSGSIPAGCPTPK